MSEQRDIIDRLNDDFIRGEITVWNLLPEAADEIASLRAQLASAWKALEVIAALEPAKIKSNMAHVQFERARNIAKGALTDEQGKS